MSDKYKILKSHNYWGQSVPNSGFQRKSYVKFIKRTLNTPLVKVLVGQRRVGKSYVMRQLISYLIQEERVPKHNIIYINKENIAFEFIQNYHDVQTMVDHHQKKNNLKGKIYVLLDEVQEIGGWEKVVSSLSQDPRNIYEVVITGSNSKLLSGELATYLTGRYISCEIHPFSYQEYIEFKNLSQNRDTYLSYLKSSGLPELFKLNDDDMKLNYMMSLYESIILKDIVKRHKVKHIDLLKNLFKFIADNIGNLFSINKVTAYLRSNDVKTNTETISTYLDYLKETFLIYDVDRYDIKGKNILSSTKKYYLNDVGFKNYFMSSYDIGVSKQLENCIYLLLRQKGYQISVGIIGSNKEIDFIAEKNTRKIYIQVTVSLQDESVVDREYGNLELIDDAYEKWVVSLDDTIVGNRNGIHHYLPWDMPL